MFYRIKQFIWAINSNFQVIDKEYINSILDKEEQSLFYSLIKSEQFHCLRVSYDLVRTFGNEKGINRDELAKLGLLHDIGKKGLNIGPIKKSIFVILKKIIGVSIKDYSIFRNINLYYNHPFKGTNILRENNSTLYSREFLEAIEMHHQGIKEISKSKNKYLIYLNICDNRN